MVRVTVGVTADTTKPYARLATATFSDGTTLSFSGGDITIFVGPNNAGKSAALRNLYDLFQRCSKASEVIKAIKLDVSGSEDELVEWISGRSKVEAPESAATTFKAHGHTIHISNAKSWWRGALKNHSLDDLRIFFCCHVTTEARLTAANPAPAISITKDAKTHPTHLVFADEGLEKRLSDDFHSAFHEDLILHPSPGKQFPFYIGTCPPYEPTPGQRRPGRDYLDKLEALPPLEGAGDGMRAFVGVLLYSTVVDYSVVLIDEPEAFLHPPQARLLARMLARKKRDDSQLFMATHSADVLRGLLDAGRGDVRVVRLRRRADINEVRDLSPEHVRALWADPLLRHSNILDGLFHEKVVVCEGDADCRFYEAIAVAVAEAQDSPPPDAIFVHCGGKGRMATVVKALRAVGVPVAAVADFDVLNTGDVLRGVLEALGGEWPAVEGDWKLTKSAVDGKKPELEAIEISEKIRAVLDDVNKRYFPRQAREEIQQILRRSTPWSTAKDQGKNFVPRGDPTQACDRLLRTCQSHGLFVVEVGQLEGFVRSVGRKGPAWVNAVLESRDLARDTELRDAREFVARITSFNPPFA